MHTCMQAHMHTHKHAHTNMHTQIHMPTHMCTCTHTHTHSSTHKQAHTCTCTLTSMYMHAHTHAYTCMHTHAHTHTPTPTHPHPHTHTHISPCLDMVEQYDDASRSCWGQEILQTKQSISRHQTSLNRQVGEWGRLSAVTHSRDETRAEGRGNICRGGQRQADRVKGTQAGRHINMQGHMLR